MNLKQYRKRFENNFRRDMQTEFNTVLNLNLPLIEALKEYGMSTDADQFYASKDVVSFDSHDGVFQCKVQRNNYRTVYLSYGTLDNKFDKEPENSLLPLDKNKQYYANINIEASSSLQIQPIIIHYSGGEKIKQTKIVEPNQLLHFDSLVDKCRLTFKLIGFGEFKLSKISFFADEKGD